MIKRYSATSQEYEIHLQLSNGKAIVLEFIGKDSVTKRRFIDVRDPLIIKALEKSPAFGVNFECTAIIEETAVEENIIIEPNVNSNTEETKEEKAPATPQEEEKQVKLPQPEFTTLKDAKAWLNKEYGIPYNKIINQTSVEREFQKRNIKLVIAKN